MAQVTYTKTFLSGHLEGLSVPCSITYPTLGGAARAATYMDNEQPKRECLTNEEYVVSDVRVID